jgi:hypothetical protein
LALRSRPASEHGSAANRSVAATAGDLWTSVQRSGVRHRDDEATAFGQEQSSGELQPTRLPLVQHGSERQLARDASYRARATLLRSVAEVQPTCGAMSSTGPLAHTRWANRSGRSSRWMRARALSLCRLLCRLDASPVCREGPRTRAADQTAPRSGQLKVVCLGVASAWPDVRSVGEPRSLWRLV